MRYTIHLVIKHKAGLLNLAEELSNVSKACKIIGVSRDTVYRYRELAAGDCAFKGESCRIRLL